MARGHRHGWQTDPPWWAWVVMAVGAVFLIAGLPLAMARGDLSDQEVAKIQAEVDAESSTSVAPTPPSLDELRADGLSLYVIGDSITDGYNASSQDQGFRPELARQLGGDVTASTDYRAGATLAEVAGAASLPDSVDVAVIELGTNDVSRNTAPDVFRARYQQLAGDLDRAAGRLVCLGTFRSGATAEALDSVIQDVCGVAGGAFVPIRDLLADDAMVAAPGSPGYPGAGDGAHPNDAGHAEIARRIMGALTA